MSQKKSSFQMGNQFNGYGDTVYLKADPVKLPPISQDNVQRSPDYSDYALKAAGVSPVVFNPESITQDIQLLMGSMTFVNQVGISRNSSGDLVTAYSVTSNSFVDNAYSTYKSSGKTVTKSYTKFFVVTQSNVNVKRTRTSDMSKEHIIASIGSGQQVKVVLENNHYVYGGPIDDTNSYNWIKVKHPVEEKYIQENETTGVEVEGWLPRIMIREDIKKYVYFNELYDYSKITMYRKYKDTDNNKDAGRVGTETTTVNSFMNWGILGTGGYPGAVKKTYDRWNVAVAPGLIDWEYPQDGGALADDVKGFSKFIKVFLFLKDSVKDSKKSIQKTIECYVYDLKAHSYHTYPYPDNIIEQLKKNNCDTKQYVSEFVVEASASVVPGLVQTGIKLPFVSDEKRLVVGFDNMDGSIIEFCGSSIDLDFNINDYELEHIEVNYERSTRGEKIKK